MPWRRPLAEADGTDARNASARLRSSVRGLAGGAWSSIVRRSPSRRGRSRLTSGAPLGAGAAPARHPASDACPTCVAALDEALAGSWALHGGLRTPRQRGLRRVAGCRG
jgi:hypothetical protein